MEAKGEIIVVYSKSTDSHYLLPVGCSTDKSSIDDLNGIIEHMGLEIQSIPVFDLVQEEN